jgi:crotonobetainyl-CoA:carnitine CoA-transferase CaiB-like acyl-CoA transferase
MSTGPLHGLLVIALEQAVAAPLATCRMADAGARVIKLERAEGDFARNYDGAAHGLSSYFVWLNRGKESVAVDLKTDADRQLLERLLHKADVFVHNLAPGAAERLAVGNAQLTARFPRLVCCQISAYGSTGPYRERKGYDLLLQAESGLASVSGTPDGPGRVGVSICDIGTGLNAYAAVLEALLQRATTGRGKAIHVSLFDSVADWMTVPLLLYEASGKVPARAGLHHVSIAPYGVFQCGDGEVLISVQNEREWRNFCGGVLNNAALAHDARFVSNAQRVANRPTLEGIIRAQFSGMSRASLVAALDNANIAFGAVNTVADLAKHPHLQRGTFATPGGPISMPLPPSVPPGFQPGAVPSIGEHTDTVRREFAAT